MRIWLARPRCWLMMMPATSFALSSVLERRGMKVLTATTGSEAVAAGRKEPEDRNCSDGIS